MTLSLLDKPNVAKKNAETTLRADAETALAARTAAASRGMSIAEYLRTVLLPVARRDVASGAKRIARGENGEGQD